MQACALESFSLILDGAEHVRNFSPGHHYQKSVSKDILSSGTYPDLKCKV